MKVDNHFNAQIAQLAMPSGENFLSTIGKGLTVFGKDRYANAAKELQLYSSAAKVHDDRLLAIKIQRQTKTALPGGESFLTAAGAKGSFLMDKAVTKAAAGGRSRRKGKRRSRSKTEAGTVTVTTARFNPAAFGVAESKSATAAPVSTPQAARTVWVGGNPVEIAIGG